MAFGRGGNKLPNFTRLPSTDTAPTSVKDTLDRLASTLGLSSVDVINELFLGWNDIVGPDLGIHCSPVRLEDGVLTVKANDQQWATELKWVRAQMITRCNEVLDPVNAIHEVRITR